MEMVQMYGPRREDSWSSEPIKMLFLGMWTQKEEAGSPGVCFWKLSSLGAHGSSVWSYPTGGWFSVLGLRGSWTGDVGLEVISINGSWEWTAWVGRTRKPAEGTGKRAEKKDQGTTSETPASKHNHTHHTHCICHFSMLLLLFSI